MMVRMTASPVLGKTNAKVKKTTTGSPKPRSSIAEGVFRKGTRVVEPLGPKRTPLLPRSPKVNRVCSKSGSKQQLVSGSRGHPRREDSDLDDLGVSIESDSDLDSSDIDEKQDWLDGSTLLAQYQDVEPGTEEERAIALVEYLQVPLQEKFHELKRDLCNGLLTAMNDIRQAHINVGQGADVDREKGIIHFNDACDKREVDASRVQQQLKDSLAVNQLEVNKLFVQLKQAYDKRNQLWDDLQERIDNITNLQAAVLDQLDDNLAHTVDAFNKRRSVMLKDDTSMDKEKLLRDVLKKL